MIPFSWCYEKVDIYIIESMTYDQYNKWSDLFIIVDQGGENWWNDFVFRNHPNWIKFKAEIEPDEELWLFKSPAITTARIRGIAAVKNNIVERYIII